MDYAGLLKGHRGWITSLSCPQQSDSYIKVVSTSRDGTAITWMDNSERHSTEQDFCVPDNRLEGHSGFVSGASLAHQGEFAVTASWDRSLRLWTLRDGQCCGKFLKHTKDVLATAFSPDDRLIVSGGRDNIIRVWNVKGECMEELVQGSHSDWVSSLCFSPDMERPTVISGSWDNTVKVWDLPTKGNKCVRTLASHTNAVTSVAVSPDGSICASGSKDCSARLWDLASGELLFSIETGAPVNQVAFSPNRFWMCVATEKSVCVYDLETKAVILELVPEGAKDSHQCTCIAWAADGKTLYTGYTDNNIRAWTVSE